MSAFGLGLGVPFWGWGSRNVALGGEITDVFLRDLFTDANSTALDAHTMDVGPGWTHNTGTFAIQSNALQANSNADGDIATVDAGESNVDISYNITPFYAGANTSRPNLVFRYSDTNNFYVLSIEGDNSSVILYRKQAGAFTAIQTINPITLTSGNTYNFTIKLMDASYVLFIDGVPKGNVVLTSFNQTATRHGVYNGKLNSPASKGSWDSFTVSRTTEVLIPYPGNPVIANGGVGDFDEVDCANPDIFDDGGMYVMNYSGWSGTNWNCGLAYSTDLITWTKEPNNPILPNDYTNCGIAKMGGTYYLLAQYIPDAKTYLFTSPNLTNGGTWTIQNGGTFVLDGFDPTVRTLDDGVTLEAFIATGAGGSRIFKRATSTDGITWSVSNVVVDSAVGVSTYMGEPFPWGDVGSSYSIYCDDNTPPDSPIYRFIRRLDTVDSGVTWTQMNVDMDFGGVAPAWTLAQRFDSAIIERNGVKFVFYAGSPDPGGTEGMNAQIGFSTDQTV